MMKKRPLIIAHRGASGYLPEHTLESYQLAIEMGADFIEPDLVATQDGHLIARHEPNLKDSTDVALHAEFAGRKRVALVDGIKEEGWFASDFTLNEIKTLRAKQMFVDRPASYNHCFHIPTFEEILALAQNPVHGRVVGVYPETKHPTYHLQLGLALEDRLLDHLQQVGWSHAQAPVYIQSFEVSNLKYLRQKTAVSLVQLIGCHDIHRQTAAYEWVAPNAQPYDWVVAGMATGYREMLTEEGLREIAQYADVVAPWKRILIGMVAKSGEQGETDQKCTRKIAPQYVDFVQKAHKIGLKVHCWTMRSEPYRLLVDYDGDPQKEYWDFFNLGVDGLFSDFSDVAVQARQTWLAVNHQRS